MKTPKYLTSRFGSALCGAFLGCTTYGQPSVEVGVSVSLPVVEVSLPSVEIRAESDFYEPLAPQGNWVVIGSYGRCWRPAHVAGDWRPYSQGYWQRTDAGWYWVSDEPWAWATYHYGRWNFTDEYGWYWVPQIQWAPAWVSWHEGGGYIGWAPLYPSGVTIILPRAYVFVEERHFMEPVSRSTVVVNNTTIINNTVINNRGPDAAIIEKAIGRKIQAVPVQELRHKQEAAVTSKQRTPVTTGEKTIQPPVRNEVQPAGQKAAPAHDSPRIQKPDAATHEPESPSPKNHQTQSGKQNPVPVAPESKPAAKSEGNPPTIQRPAGQQPEKQLKPVPPPDKKLPQPAREHPAANDNNGANPADRNQKDKGKE